MYSPCRNSISQRFVQQQNNVYVRQYTYILYIFIIHLSPSLPKDRTKGISTHDERKRCAFDFVTAGLSKFFYVPNGKNRPFQTQKYCHICRLESTEVSIRTYQFHEWWFFNKRSIVIATNQICALKILLVYYITIIYWRWCSDFEIVSHFIMIKLHRMINLLINIFHFVYSFLFINYD